MEIINEEIIFNEDEQRLGLTPKLPVADALYAGLAQLDSSKDAMRLIESISSAPTGMGVDFQATLARAIAQDGMSKLLGEAGAED